MRCGACGTPIAHFDKEVKMLNTATGEWGRAPQVLAYEQEDEDQLPRTPEHGAPEHTPQRCAAARKVDA